MLVSQSPGVVSAHVAGTTPYPWPWNGDLTAAKTAVVVVAPTGSADAEADAVVTTALAVVAAVRAAGGTVIRVTTVPPPRAGAGASRWFAGLEPDEEATSAGIDGFYGSALEAILRRRAIERLILVGVGLETCLHSTMRSANDRGYECLLVVDGCLPHDRALVASAVSMIEMSGGIFGAVGTATAVTDAFSLHRKDLP